MFGYNGLISGVISPGNKRKNARSGLQEISGMNKRIKFLGYSRKHHGIIAMECSERRGDYSEYTNRASERLKIDRKENSHSIIGVRHCLKCKLIYEIVPGSGAKRSEFHIYKGISPCGHRKRDCPYCLGESHKYMIVG